MMGSLVFSICDVWSYEIWGDEFLRLGFFHLMIFCNYLLLSFLLLLLLLMVMLVLPAIIVIVSSLMKEIHHTKFLLLLNRVE